MDIYVDGSFIPDVKRTASAYWIPSQDVSAVLVEIKDTEKLTGIAAAELRSVGLAINKCFEMGVKHVRIFYDFDGVMRWAVNNPHSQHEFVQQYHREIADAKSRGLHMEFIHVKAHHGNVDNDRAHDLCYDACHGYLLGAKTVVEHARQKHLNKQTR